MRIVVHVLVAGVACRRVREDVSIIINMREDVCISDKGCVV